MNVMKPLIFVVEDEADIARLVKHHLEAAGFNARIFPAAPLVVPEAEREKPALFLLDIMIPGGDGFELCRRIRQNQAIAMTPVIFLTAKTSESDRVLGLELGADDYIGKTFSPRELIARGGFAGMEQYWGHTLLEESPSLGFTITRKPDVFRIDFQCFLKIIFRFCLVASCLIDLP